MEREIQLYFPARAVGLLPFPVRVARGSGSGDPPSLKTQGFPTPTGVPRPGEEQLRGSLHAPRAPGAEPGGPLPVPSIPVFLPALPSLMTQVRGQCSGCPRSPIGLCPFYGGC